MSWFKTVVVVSGMWASMAGAVQIQVIDAAGNAVNIDTSQVTVVEENNKQGIYTSIMVRGKNAQGAMSTTRYKTSARNIDAIYVAKPALRPVVVTPKATPAPSKAVVAKPVVKAPAVKVAPTPAPEPELDEDAHIRMDDQVVTNGFVVQTQPRMDPFDGMILGSQVKLKLIEPTAPDVKTSWYKVSVDGVRGGPYYIDSHSMNLIRNTRGADGKYSFNPDKLSTAPRTLDVQVKDKDSRFEMNDIAYIDTQSRNGWGGILVVTKDGRRGYTAEMNIPKLAGIPLERDTTEAKREIVDVIEEPAPAPEAKSKSPDAAPRSAHNGNEFPQSFKDKLHNPELVNMRGNAKDPGYGNIDRQYTNLLNPGSEWTVKPVCNLYKKEICKAFNVNNTPSPTRAEFLAMQAIAYQESHTDPFAFRYEKKFATRSPSWISTGFAEYQEANKDLDYTTQFRQYHTSYGLMQVFLPALSEWYPEDPSWKAKVGGAADIKAVVDHPAKLLDPTTNFIWGIRIVRQNYQRSLKMTNAGNSGMSTVAKMAAAYNGGQGSLRSVPPAVSAVGCRKGIDTNCPRNGARRVPYFEAVESISKALQNQCNVPASPCGEIAL